MEPIYKERGGGWVGNGILNLQASWPLSSIAIYKDKVVLTVLWKVVEVPFSDIVTVERIYIVPYLVEGIKIAHRNTELPTLLRFWSFGHSQKIVDLINAQLSQSPSGM